MTVPLVIPLAKAMWCETCQCFYASPGKCPQCDSDVHSARVFVPRMVVEQPAQQ